MLVRVWRTGVIPRHAAAYEAFARERSLPMFERAPGCAGVVCGRVGSQAVVVTLWDDRAALAAFETSDAYTATVEAIENSGYLAGRPELAVYEVHESWRRDSSSAG